MQSPGILVLDFGFYPRQSAIRDALIAAAAQGGIETLSVDAADMSADDWDGILEKILQAGKSMTI